MVPLNLYFASEHTPRAAYIPAHDTGGTLKEDSPPCRPCFFDGYRDAPRLFFISDKPTLVGHSELQYIELDGNPPRKDARAFLQSKM